MTFLRRSIRLAPAVGSALLLVACDGGGDDPADIASEARNEASAEASGVAPGTASGRISYGAGYAMADNMSQQLGEDFDGPSFAMGVNDAVAQRDRKVSDADLTAARDEIVARREQEAAQAAETNLEEASTFLSQNETREDVQTTDSGLQYEVLEEGDGPSPAAEDTVVVHYTGTLLDGTVFDSSRQRGQPATFPVGQVIPGWTEALQLMSVGDRYQLWLPPDLAYGERPPSPAIPPNALLVFDVELLEIQSEAVEEETGMSGDG